MDAFVSPSRQDGLSAALLEAMVAGVPCVAARNPSVDGAFHGGEHLLLTPAGDATALAGAVDAILKDRRIAARLADAERARASEVARLERSVIALHELHEWLATKAAPRFDRALG